DGVDADRRRLILLDRGIGDHTVDGGRIVGPVTERQLGDHPVRSTLEYPSPHVGGHVIQAGPISRTEADTGGKKGATSDDHVHRAARVESKETRAEVRLAVDLGNETIATSVRKLAASAVDELVLELRFLAPELRVAHEVEQRVEVKAGNGARRLREEVTVAG